VARYLVTGAAQGVGAAVARALAGDHEVIALGRSEESLAKTPAEQHIVADLGRPDALAAQLPALESLESLDGLVNCAGLLHYGRTDQFPVDQWRELMDINVVAQAELTRLLLPALRASRGTVVFVNSGQGLAASAGMGAYAASKHALRAVADALRAEEPEIRVGSLYLGRTATGMQRQLQSAQGGTYDEKQYIQAETAAGVITQMLTLPADAVLSDVTLRPHA
jgi:short-subunit dehydrogenase